MHDITPEDRRLTLICVIMVFGLSAMSQTVVATAMPRIVAELSGLHLYAWVTTAYILASTVSVPIWGKLGDIVGRKIVLLAGTTTFLVGAWLSGLAGEFGSMPLLGGGMTQLIVFRAIQGLGGGAVFTTATAIVADIYGPRERARFGAAFSTVFGVASVIGPVVGGFFTDHGTVTLLGHEIAGWRWVFYVNLPLAVPALLLLFFRMPTLPARGSGKIDYLGAILLVTSFVPLLLALNWGGHSHPWSSPLIIGLLLFGVVMLVAFVLVERAVWDPILPLQLFADPNFRTAICALFFLGLNYLSLSTFLPLFMQVGQGRAATESGLTMLAMMTGMVTSSTVVGQIVARTGRLKPLMILGGATLLAGVGSLCLIGPDTSTLGIAWRLLIVGIGVGPAQNLLSLTIQNGAQAHEMGVATASTQFVRQIGQTVGVAVFGAVLTATLASEMQARAPQGGAARHMELGDLQRMALDRQDRIARSKTPVVESAEERTIRQSFTVAVRHGLWLCLAATVLAFILMLRTPGERLADRKGALQAADES